VLALLFLFTWKNMVASLWIALTGRKWVENASNFGFIGVVLVGTGIGLWIFFHPEWHAAAIASVLWILGLLLLVKLVVATCVVSRLISSGLTTAGVATLMVTMWLATISILCGLALYLLPGGYSAPANIVSGIALFVPFSRIAGAPLALEWNRHR
jgi:hypothetical protein